MKKIIALLAALVLLAALTACAAPGQASDPNMGSGGKPSGGSGAEKTVGICLPEQTSQRWEEDARELTAYLEQKGFRVLLENARQDAALQANQVAQMIALPVDCLVVAAVDSISLLQVLEQANNANIPVIAYDRLLMSTNAVSCYVGFDSRSAGRQLAQHIADAKQLQQAQQEAGSYTVEFFMGSPEDSNAALLYMGVMEVLQPYLDSGTLVCCSGRVAFEDTCIQGWSQDTARQDCLSYLMEYYMDAPPDILCAASDAVAQGCREALVQAEYTLEESWPVLTGQGASLDAARSILSGQQSMTLFADSGQLTQLCVSAVEAALSGTVDSWAETVCHNGSVEVPATLCTPVVVDAQNLRQILVDGGVYTDAQLTEESQ